MKIVVTGGGGFIGTNMLIMLRQRYENAQIVSIDNRETLYNISGIEYIKADVTDLHIFKYLKDADKIFHLAAVIGTHESFDDVAKVMDTNIKGTLNILDFVKESGAELFIAGMPGIWQNPYSISKDTAVRLAMSYYDAYNIKVAVLRWYSVYGQYQYISRYNKAVPTFINRALRNDPIPIYGNGMQVADFIHVNDAVRYAIDILEIKAWGKTIQCGTGVGTSVNELVETVINLCSSKSVLKYLPMRVGEPNDARVIANITEIKKLFPKYSTVSLIDGLKETIEFYTTSSVTD